MALDSSTVHTAAHDGEMDAASAATEVASRPPLGLVSPSADTSTFELIHPAVQSRSKKARKKRGVKRAPRSLALPDVLAALLKCGRLGGEPVAASLWMLNPATNRLELIDSVGSVRPAPNEQIDRHSLMKRALEDQALVCGRLRRVTTLAAKTTVWRLVLPLAFTDGGGVGVLDFVSDSGDAPKRLRKAVRALAGYLSGALALRALQAEADSARDLADSLGSLASQIDPDTIVAECLARAMELVSADSGSLMLVDPSSRTMRIAASVGIETDTVASTEVSEGEGVSGWVLATGQPMAIEDLDRTSPRSGKRGHRSAISVPLSDSEGVLGVLNVARHESRGCLSRADMQAIRSLGRFSAIVLRRARLARNDRDAYFGTVASLAAAMEAREPGAAVSSQRVVGLALQLGVAMDVGERVLEALRIAALLHDVGMAAAGESVSVSGRPLSTFEWGMLKMHPLVAVDIIAQVPALADVVPIVRHHHEHWDGSGYVAGLAAEEIPVGARILAVADAFVAMTSERPYRKALSTGQALAELSSKAGSQFDPVVVRVLAEQSIGEADLPS